MKRGKIFILVIIFLSLLAVFSIKLRSGKKSTGLSDISHSISESSGLQDILASLNIISFSETRKAPEFELISLEGEKTSLSQFQGKAVMLSFWSTW